MIHIKGVSFKKPGLNKTLLMSDDHRKINKMVKGLEYRVVILLAGINVVWISLLKYKNPYRAIRIASQVFERRKRNKSNHNKIAKAGNRYYLNLNSPGWPSKAFNNQVAHLLNIYAPKPEASLLILLFAITNKCSFQCEHCLDWEHLNKKDSLSTTAISDIINRFHRLGISQVQLSGGEPLNRLKDILQVLDEAPEDIDFWLYTNGYNFNDEKAALLKAHGLKGIIISLDHHEAEKHDQFRGVKGSYERAIQSARIISNSGLMLAFSCCATNDFISRGNLLAYAKICHDSGASFIQLMEPQAVGHYKQKNVGLKEENKRLLEWFVQLLNFDPAYSDYPIVTYPDMIKREYECAGGGHHLLYVDADGYVNSCPFCHKRLFHATDPNLAHKVLSLKEKGCSLVGFDSIVERPVQQSQTLEKVK
jgi:MoaA/NifB/PqqE/SkfB family radical SAM enzyme